MEMAIYLPEIPTARFEVEDVERFIDVCRFSNKAQKHAVEIQKKIENEEVSKKITEFISIAKIERLGQKKVV